MKKMVLVVIPNSIAIKVSKKYTNLRRQRLRSGSRKPYPITKLRANIANALSINGGYVDPHDLKEPLYSLWITNKYKVLPYNHWFYAVQLMRNANGETIAKVVDALYEADYHNDTMQTRPFVMDNPDDMSHLVDWKELKLKNIIQETVNQYLKQNLIAEMAIPKSHQRLIDKYCSRRQLRGYHQDDVNRYDSQLEEYNKEYQNFLQTGTVSHEFLEKLLDSYKSIVDMLVGTSKGNYSHYDDCDELERELQSKGYDTEELYNNYVSRQ